MKQRNQEINDLKKTINVTIVMQYTFNIIYFYIMLNVLPILRSKIHNKECFIDN